MTHLVIIDGKVTHEAQDEVAARKQAEQVQGASMVRIALVVDECKFTRVPQWQLADKKPGDSSA